MREQSYPEKNCFHLFKSDVSHISLPARFTYPFNYHPHPLAAIASRELQDILIQNDNWAYDFGLSASSSKKAVGKMFGVLVARDKDMRLGYLAAYSGKLGENHDYIDFVPPIVNLLDKEGFYKKGEAELIEINKEIAKLEASQNYKELQNRYLEETQKAEELLSNMRKALKQSKKERAERRESAKLHLSVSAYEELCERLKHESLDGQYKYKRTASQKQAYLTNIKSKLDELSSSIEALKKMRQNKSALLQKKIFSLFQFLNQDGQTKSLVEIFDTTQVKTPPSGAGECALPKLLQYAYTYHYQPLAMAEFWWGAPPNSEVRKHKEFYPSCRGKCEPILSHMLKGLDVDSNPMLINQAVGKELVTLFEDESILVIDKPAEFLSTPGKLIHDSVQTRVEKLYSHCNSPFIVHRLDMSTSGIMVIAKTKFAHEYLQRQFIEKTVQKRYTALLSGTISPCKGIVDLPLRVDLDNRPQQLVCYKYGKRAITRYKVIESIDGITRIHFFPQTGRTHQLRIHSAHHDGLSAPIVGDDIYGRKGERLCLHADMLSFIHPLTNKRVKFISDVPF